MDTEIKSVLDSLKEGIGGFQAAVKSLTESQTTMQRQLDGIEIRAARPGDSGGRYTKSLADLIAEHDGFKAFAQTSRGRVAIPVGDFQVQAKTAITATGVGATVSGVMAIDRQPGIVPAALRTFRMRELLRQIPTTLGAVDFVRVLTYPKASPQVEAQSKTEGAMTFEAAAEKVRTLAHWVPASKQVVSDLAGLQETINVHLLAGLLDVEDEQILAGDATGENLNGLIGQATAFDSSLLIAADGYEWADCIGRAIQQLTVAKHRATGIVMHPADWWKIILAKDSTGQYIYGNPQSMVETRLWSLPVSVTDAIDQGTFLVGDFMTGAALFMRMDGVIEVADQHSDYFIKNMLAVRCEERIALACYKPGAFVTGAFAQSPA